MPNATIYCMRLHNRVLLEVKKLTIIITEKMASGIFSLPLYPKLKINEVLKVSKTLKKIFQNF